MEVKCYRTETYHVHALIELGRIGGKGYWFESFISPTFCQRDGIGRRVRLRSGCLYGVEGSSHPRVFLNLSYYAKEHDHSTSCSFCFIVVLSEDSGIFRDTTILRQGMLTKQSMSDSSMK